MQGMMISRFTTACLLFALAVSLAGCPSDVTTQVSDKEVQTALTNIFEQRQFSEDAVKEGGGRFKSDPKRLQELKKRYNIAAAKGNAFIEIVQFNLTAGSLQGSDLESRATEVVEAVQRLEEYAYPPTRGPIVGAVISGAIEGLAKAGLIVWERTKDQEARVVENIKQELEKRKWKKFENLSH